jgi:hypothetical protein
MAKYKVGDILYFQSGKVAVLEQVAQLLGARDDPDGYDCYVLIGSDKADDGTTHSPSVNSAWEDGAIPMTERSIIRRDTIQFIFTREPIYTT